MKVSEIVQKINESDNTVASVASELNCHRATLSQKLKTVGYSYKQNMQIYVYEGDENKKKTVDGMDFSEIKVPSKKKKVSKKSEENQKKDDVVLTNEEKDFIKKFYESQKKTDAKFEIMFEWSRLPKRKPEKKFTPIISEKTHNEWEDFSDKMEDEFRIKKNDLLELALRKFMKDFS